MLRASAASACTRNGCKLVWMYLCRGGKGGGGVERAGEREGGREKRVERARGREKKVESEREKKRVLTSSGWA